ncbi:lipopolysaccharide biosynthesis [Candidatus Koribacter versatilis Ellin345]|uniref:Lipopolysaccharide biosynthesis n=1 Tax=Koribacter versatilis (strain Ellin345) TaxID=204669 RepID=Q1ITA8_KORVE|nr:Wzz/FepE/Etk N-terminal domain-containing protein [Candidatus Koribacter versatilis]ABF39892.1 lipopolysaccharide biosynthesis [Candidatus Koribacter versatilis Ellin345]
MPSDDRLAASVDVTNAVRVSSRLDRLAIGWERRGAIVKAAVIGVIVSTTLAFVIPKQYESTARIMPPEGGMSSAIMAALASRALPGNLGAIAGSLFGFQSTSTVFVNLLQSRSVTERVVDRFDLQKVYRSRYKQDALKKLHRRTEIAEDRKTGIITITVADTDRRRARDMAQTYLDELNSLVTRVNSSAAGREREFIAQRLVTVKRDLDDAERQLSVFSTKNATLDVKEQTRAMVEATAKLEGELIIARSELSSLDQIYGPENVRVRAGRARVGQLEHELKNATGSGVPSDITESTPYPPLRALPTLGVQWADLYRRVKLQETVFELLTQEYELARIEEAKAIPSISVIDPPNWPERKSFPPRLVIMLVGTLLSVLGTFFVIVRKAEWRAVPEEDPKKLLFRAVMLDLKEDSPQWLSKKTVHHNGHEL